MHDDDIIDLTVSVGYVAICELRERAPCGRVRLLGAVRWRC